MSDPMTNMKGDEDVLASIRRLVVDSRAARDRMTNGHPSAANAAPKASEANGTSGAPELLLLTTDFLVEKPDNTPSDVEGNPPLILGPDLAVVKTDEPEVAEQEDAPAEATNAWHAQLDDTPDGDAAKHAAKLNLEQRIAELEAAIGSVEEEWEPDGSESLEGETPQGLPRGFADIVLSMRAKTEQTSDPDEATDAEMDALDVAEPSEAASDVVEPAPSDAIEETAEVVEASVDVLEDTLDAETLADLTDDLYVFDGDDAEDVSFDEPQNDEEQAHFSDDEEVLDEHMLRALVADVLNEELRGQLGERMTRNIRRLVRREVQRALSVRDLQ
ncbi:hypothetical protein [Celeribacter sp.]|uniref:hypothetical protein n=1 Tax=Celeribacter sp. TaxID=1890673 RepID=UPI003A95DE47